MPDVVPTPAPSSDGADALFRRLADATRDAALVRLDGSGTVTVWGEGARAMTGWSREQAEGARWARWLVADAGGGDAEALLREAAADGERCGEWRFTRADGSTFPAHVTLTALRTAGGDADGFVLAIRDQTAAHAIVAARAAELVADVERQRSRFLATMSHEIRTPIHAVVGFTGLLEDSIGGGTLNEKQRHYLARLRASGAYLTRLVDDILDLSRLEAGTVQVECLPIRVGPCVTGAIEVVEPQARGHDLELVSTLDAATARRTCCGDEQRLQQVLVILLANAVQFTDRRGDVPGRVTVSVDDAVPPPGTALQGDGPWMRITVADNGHGIPADRLEAVFEPFVQLEPQPADQPKHTGLGLALGRGLARLMGGDLTVRSTVDVGTSFDVWLADAPIAARTDAPAK